MADHIHWILEMAIKDGELENFQTLKAEMIEATQSNEPDTLMYEWYVSDDEKQCHIYERYVDSAAVMVHLGNFGAKFADRFLAALTPQKLTVYGDASDEVRGALAGLGAVHMHENGGFAR